ncbi:MAG: hypothetical protein JW951_02255, partial [Lentisphaerae bacterium]|nr:hypothetical protein [Lentisphaerota bacterium]
MGVLLSMFCLGAFSTAAQVLFMRELLVVFFGNELCIGLILACWLTGIGGGAFTARWLLRRGGGVGTRSRGILVWLWCAAGAALPLQVCAARTVRLFIGVPPGEYAPFGTILAGAFLVLLPTCFSIGLYFPLACQALAEGRDGGRAGAAVGALYRLEAAGSMACGALLTFVLLPLWSPVRLVTAALAPAAAGAALLLGGQDGGRRWARRGAWAAAAAVLAAAALRPAGLAALERQAIRARWRAFGVLGRGTRLVCSGDSVYQNLAVTESGGQYALYANGQVMFVFPDPIAYEHAVHAVMAQKPGARRVLMLGGNPLGELPELLKYPLDRLVYVELDPAVSRLLRKAAPARLEAVLGDPRVAAVYEDIPRYVRRCRERFDIVCIQGPHPDSAYANRFYTRTFYSHIRRILAADGFMTTTVTTSERLRGEAVLLGSSIYRTLREVFPHVRVTAGGENRFYAGRRGADLTFDAATLVQRARSAAV